MINQLDYIEKYTLTNASPVAVIIWLHGLGADANDFVPIIPQLNLIHSVKFIFPNAPLRPISLNNGQVMRGWYDIYNLNNDITTRVDTTGIAQSIMEIEQLIDMQINTYNFKPQQIILAGFSQGAAIAYLSGIKSKHTLSGVIGLSGYIPDTTQIKYNLLKPKMSFFCAHGTQDNIVNYQLGYTAYTTLCQYHYTATWHEYPEMQHSVCPTEIDDIGAWLNQNIAMMKH